jgi:hypothetical protein
VSAIDEALKRARADAARRSAAERGAAGRWVPVHPLTRQRRRPYLWAGIAGSCLVVGVAVGLVVAGFSRQDGAEELRRPDVRAEAVVEKLAAAAEEREEKEQVGRQGSGVPGGEPAKRADEAASPGAPLARSDAAEAGGPRGLLREEGAREATGGAASHPAPRPDRSEPEPAPPVSAPSPPGSSSPARSTPPAPEATTDRTPASPPSPPADGPPAAATPPPGEAAPQGAAPAPQPAPEEPTPTYVRRAQLPGGGEIALGGIAFSTNPVALLNGKVVGVGEVVDGMKVVAIVPGRVDLEGRGTRLALLIK